MAQKNVTIRAAVEGGDKVKAELRDIGAAATGGLGTVSQKAGEAAGGLDKAAGGTSRLNGALGRLVNGGGLRNTAQQLNQVVQSGVATGNWTTALAVQMPDLLLGFGTFGAVAGAVAGFLIPLAANLFTTRDSVDALEESVKRMNSSFGEYKKAVDLLLSEDLAAQFGTLADAIRPVLDALQENRRLTAVDEIREGVRTAVDEIVKGGINAENALEVWDDLAEDFGLNVTNIFGNFVEGGREVGAQVRALRDAAVAFNEVSKAGGGLADQLLAGRQLLAIYTQVADADGKRTENERSYIAALGETLSKLAEMQAQEERLAAAAEARSTAAEDLAASAGAANAAAAATMAAAPDSSKLLADATATAQAAMETSGALASLEDSSAAAQAALSQALDSAGTVQATADAVARVKESWTEFQAIVGTDLTSVTQPFLAGMDSMIAKADEAAMRIPAALTAAMEGLRALVETAALRGQEIGSALVDGMVAGIGANSGRVISRAQALAAEVEGTVRDALKIRSPSRVMQELGRFVSEGLGLGIEQGAASPVGATHRLADGVVGAAEGLRDGLKSVLKTAITDFENLDSAISSVLSSIASKLMDTGLNSLFGAFFGGDPLTSALAAAGAPVAVMHSGGVAGVDGGTRSVPMAAFLGAQRYHGGGWPGLRPNEVPAILERGERVLPRHEAAGGGQSAVRIDLGPGLIAEVLSEARGQSVQVVQRAAPGIVSAAIKQSVALHGETRIYD